MARNLAADAHFASVRAHAIQLGRLLGDPLLSLWVDERAVEQFVSDELSALDPFSVQITHAEARWCQLWHRQAQDEGR